MAKFGPLHAPKAWIKVPSEACTSPAAAASSSLLRIVSFNTLAQTLVWRSLYPYSSKLALRVSHRKKRLLEEIVACQGDVVCLQEIDADLYQSWWKPQLERFDYKSYYVPRSITYGTKSAHGLVIARRSYVRLIDSLVWHFAPTSEVRHGTRLRFPQIALYQLLEAHGQRLVVGTTHLLHKQEPTFRFTRLCQVEEYIRTGFEWHSECNVRIFTGDWNMLPSDPLYRFVLNGSIDDALYFCAEYEKSSDTANYIDRNDVKANITSISSNVDSGVSIEDTLTSSDQIPAETASSFEPVTLDDIETIQSSRGRHPLLRSCYSMFNVAGGAASITADITDGSCEPPFTNYTKEFKGTLDFIMLNCYGSSAASTRNSITHDVVFPAEVTALLSLPINEVSKEQGLPNDKFGSDHLPIGVEIKLPST